MTDDFAKHYPLRAARAHEVCGAAAASFAAILCGLHGGNVLWVVEDWRSERLNPEGLSRFCDPEKILVAEAGNHLEQLALTEEALRSGAVLSVVTEISKSLDLTAGRRLQLAAEAGSTPCILIIPDGMGSNAAETRWRCQPEFAPEDSTRMHWDLIKNKSGTLRSWVVRWDEQAHRIAVVSPSRE